LIFENLTSWNTEDLRRVMDLALSVVNDKGEKVGVRVDTPIVARHYTARSGLVSASFDPNTRSAILRLRRPGRVDLEVVDALASVMDGALGRMPREMVEHVFLGGLALVRGRSYQDGWTSWAAKDKPPPPELDEIQVRASRTRHRRSPAWLRRQLEAAEKEMDRINASWRSEVGLQQRKIDAIRAKLAAQENPS